MNDASLQENGTEQTAGDETLEAPRRRRWWWEAALVVGFWTVLAVLMASNDLLNAGEGTASGAKARDVLRPFWQFYFWALLTPTIFWACRRYRIEQPHLARRILAHIGLAVIVSFTVDIYNDYLRLLTQPDEEQPAAFNPLGELLELSLIYELMVYLVVLAAGFARDYFLRFQARQREAARLQTRTARLEEQLAAARLDALRMQINPHFLFNTLHAVSTLVGDDPQGVRRMIARLSRLLRYVLDETDRQEVPLHQEMRFLRTYLEIMQIRFQGSLHTKIDVASDLDDALVPNLILQPLVENAVKHGAGETEEVGRVEVHAEAEAGRLLLTVRDNGPHVSADGASNLPEGTGLKNVRARLNGLYGSDAELTFSAVPDGGLTARIALPLRTESKRGRKHERTREQVETSE